MTRDSGMPPRVTIDGVLYDVRLVKLDAEDGEFCAASQAIKVQEGAGVAYQRVVLLHELIHACYEHAGSPPGPLGEEQVACMISRRLLPILRDNPEVVRWLTS